MKNQWKGFISGVLVTLLLTGTVGTTAATVGTKAAELEYNNIKVTLDGAPVKLVDANGNPVEPFVISGTTYLPVRAVAGALGLGVDWDGSTQTVILKHSGAVQPSNSQGSKPIESSSGMTTGQKNALNAAKQYLKVLAFSRSGLIKQLEYEKYSTEEATFAVDNCGADWYEQAAKKAQQYIDLMSFSRQRLIDQLKYEGFTQAEAEYGASAVGY